MINLEECGKKLDNNEKSNSNFNSEEISSVIKDVEFSDLLTLDAVFSKDKKIVFENCKFDSISFKNVSPKLLTFIRFVSCEIESLLLYGCSLSKLLIEKSSVKSVWIYKTKTNLTAEESTVDTICIDKRSELSDISIVIDSQIRRIDAKDATVGKIRIHKSELDEIKINKGAVDIGLENGATIEKIYIEDHKGLTDLIKQGKKIKSLIECRHYKQIITAVFKGYEDAHRYAELDMCLVELRKIDCLIKRNESKSPFKKLVFILQDLVIGKMFGWGVKIINTLITTLVIVVAFSVLYFAVGESISFIDCFLISLNRFFGVIDFTEHSIIGRLDSFESVLGVIMLTGITGVIVRKIIR